MSDVHAFEQQLIREFAETLAAEAEDKRSEFEGQDSAEDAALADVILSRLEEAGAISEYELCPHEDKEGQRRCRIVAYSLPDDTTRLELFTVRVGKDDDSNLTRTEIAKLTGWAARFFDYSIKGEFERFAQNKPALAAATHIHEQGGRIADVRVHVLTNCTTRDRNVDSLELQGRLIEFEVWDLERLYRTAGEEVTRDRIEVDFSQLMGRPIACLEMKPPPQDYQTFLFDLPIVRAIRRSAVRIQCEVVLTGQGEGEHRHPKDD